LKAKTIIDKKQSMSPKPIIYQAPVKIRFSDIDRYQHVNTTYYPDYVFTARFEYMKKRWGTDPNQFEKEGIGFYTTRFESIFLKPILASVSEILITSNVYETDRSLLKIQFQITDLDQKVQFSKGSFDMFVIDLKTQKPVREIPETMKALIWET
jgi:acyl-CoA thioesterase FadM